MLSEEEMKTKMDSLADGYMQKYLPEAKVDDFENLAIAFSYRHTVNLIKHSKTLSIWTIVIGASTILLFISAVMQLIKLCFFP